MRVAFLAPLLALAALPAGTAHASPPLYTGTTCSLVAASDLVGVNTFVGVIDASVAAVDLVHLDGNPANVSVSCSLNIVGSGGLTYTRTASGAVAAVLAETIQFVATPTAAATLCTTVVAADRYGSSTQLGPFCRDVSQNSLLPVRTMTVGPEWIALR